MDSKNNKILVLLLMLILILLYLLIQKFGYLENQNILVPTGNVDIFEIDCNCCGDKENTAFKEDEKINDETIKNKMVIKKNEGNNDDTSKNIITEDNDKTKDLIIYDNYKIWDNKELRIFSNPSYEYRNIIAPGSFNSYTFVIRNNNDFDVVIDIEFEELNDKKINMKYKLKNNGFYLIGAEDRYESINDMKITEIKLPAKSQKSYILDWKWIDNYNDTQIGIDANANYKLSIMIGAN